MLNSYKSSTKLFLGSTEVSGYEVYYSIVVEDLSNSRYQYQHGMCYSMLSLKCLVLAHGVEIRLLYEEKQVDSEYNPFDQKGIVCDCTYTICFSLHI